MDSLEDLASAARQARSSTAPPHARPRSNAAPVVLAIVFASLVIGGAIVFLALHRGGPTQPTPTANANPVAPPQGVDPEELARQAKAQAAAFRAFAARLAEAMARQRKAALESDNAASDTVVTYTCAYKLSRMGTLNASNGLPSTFQATYDGTIEGKGQSFHSTETGQITTAFALAPDGRWTIDAASERTLTRKTSADLFGVPEKGGPKRDIAHIDWFNAAVKEAQQPDAGKK
ncbi:MAG TPA: hypothetical protein VGI81_27710 [Tepidisphaeraceae bacterium]|jgi:hypothetical protein